MCLKGSPQSESIIGGIICRSRRKIFGSKEELGSFFTQAGWNKMSTKFLLWFNDDTTENIVLTLHFLKGPNNTNNKKKMSVIKLSSS